MCKKYLITYNHSINQYKSFQSILPSDSVLVNTPHVLCVKTYNNSEPISSQLPVDCFLLYIIDSVFTIYTSRIHTLFMLEISVTRNSP